MKTKMILQLSVVTILSVFSVSCSNSNDGEKPSTPPPAAPQTSFHKDVNLGMGRYIKFVEREGRIYAGVVIPEKMLLGNELPGKDRDIARLLLISRTKTQAWVDEKVEQKRGYMVFIFKTPTEKETKAAKRLIEEMSQPLVQQPP